LPSRSPLAWLFAKEWRELMASRAWWGFLLLMGPLVGVSFIDAVRTYAETSGLHGTTAGVGEAFSPLIGVWAPTFSACEIGAAFLLPFVAIRVVAGDRQSALKLESQHAVSPFVRVGMKAAVLLIGWVIASAAPLIALGLWRAYGGTLYAPEIASVVIGHVLNAGLVVALAAMAASVTEHPSTAAIVTLRGHRRHLDSQLRRGGAWRSLGEGRRLHADGDGGGVPARARAPRRSADRVRVHRRVAGLRRGVAKLRRVMPDVDIEYVSATSIGLFEQSNPHYGEIRFAMQGRTAVSRSTSAEGVLETIYDLAGTAPPPADEEVFRGHPLAAPPRGAAVVFYALWPAAVAGASFLWRRQS
jgi:hypothetical protein